MPDNYYISSIRQNCKQYQQELNELHAILTSRNLSRFEYRAAERSLQVSIEVCIGVAKHWCKQLKQLSPSDAYQAFEALSQNGVFSNEELVNWRKIIGLRNALVHDYLNIDPEIIRSVISERYYQPLFEFIEMGLQALEK